MLKKEVNRIQITFNIVPDGYLLIAKGNTTRPIEFYKMGNSYVIPGSSFKGIMRSHIERIVKAISPQKVCVPLGNASYSKRINSESSIIIYKESCAVCRMFGNLKLQGRWSTIDSFGNNVKIERKAGNAIDRFTGGARDGALFEYEGVVSGVFPEMIHGINFELYQLGLIGQFLNDLNDGIVKIGHGKSKGFGKVKVQNLKIKISYINDIENKVVKDLSCFVNEDYGFYEKNSAVNIPNLPDYKEDGIRKSFELTGDEAWQFFNEISVKL